MIPAFTNAKRKKLYNSDPRKGFTYINWEIEEELKKFQKEIEQRFKVSMVNKMFKFPKIHEDEDTAVRIQLKVSMKQADRVQVKKVTNV